MTDKELLELAAKAAGINIFDWTPGGRPTTDGSYDGIWNPLDDDGDALRLAVALYMVISINRIDGYTEASCGYSNIDLVNLKVNHEKDMHAAPRRAIVRAAAEMGRDKP